MKSHNIYVRYVNILLSLSVLYYDVPHNLGVILITKEYVSQLFIINFFSSRFETEDLLREGLKILHRCEIVLCIQIDVKNCVCKINMFYTCLAIGVLCLFCISKGFAPTQFPNLSVLNHTLFKQNYNPLF